VGPLSWGKRTTPFFFVGVLTKRGDSKHFIHQKIEGIEIIGLLIYVLNSNYQKKTERKNGIKAQLYAELRDVKQKKNPLTAVLSSL